MLHPNFLNNLVQLCDCALNQRSTVKSPLSKLTVSEDGQLSSSTHSVKWLRKLRKLVAFTDGKQSISPHVLTSIEKVQAQWDSLSLPEQASLARMVSAQMLQKTSVALTPTMNLNAVLKGIFYWKDLQAGDNEEQLQRQQRHGKQLLKLLLSLVRQRDAMDELAALGLKDPDELSRVDSHRLRPLLHAIESRVVGLLSQPEHLPRLRSLSLGGKHLPLQRCAWKAYIKENQGLPLFHHNFSLKHPWGDRNFSASSRQALLTVLRESHDLKQLDLSKFQPGQDLLHSIIPALQHSPTLEGLRLEACAMGPQAAFIRPLLEAMGKQRALRVLLLPHNDLSDTQSIKDLGRLIAENTKLERLDLNSCQIAGPGSEELIQGLWNQRSLQQLSLAGSAWTEKSFDRLISLLPRLKLLHALDLGNCTFSSSQVKKLLDSLDALGRRTLSVNLHGSLIGLEEQLLVEAFNGRMLKEGRPLHVDSTRIWP